MAGTYAGNAIACAAANATFAPWSCMELYGAVLPWHSHLNHLIHPSSSSSQISQVGCDDGTQLHGNSGCPGGALVRGSMRCCNRFCKVQGSRLCLLEFIVTYMTYSDHWPRRKGLEDLRARYPEVIQEVLQCRVPFPLMTLMRGELTWLVASNYWLQCDYNILPTFYDQRIRSDMTHDLTWLDQFWVNWLAFKKNAPFQGAWTWSDDWPGISPGWTSGYLWAARRHGQISMRQPMKSIYICIYNDNDICVLQTVEWKHLTFKSGGQVPKGFAQQMVKAGFDMFWDEVGDLETAYFFFKCFYQ